ncbi:hypothetical protein BKA70DRAFT_1416217 [Coprinopsis sp. MPI-PUGE-AT-0042]|nr:hypothetical protein BKA70DRAFT_1416217 [Coprinopsis sp. MPI-PUGE-AT-0042]
MSIGGGFGTRIAMDDDEELPSHHVPANQQASAGKVFSSGDDQEGQELNVGNILILPAAAILATAPPLPPSASTSLSNLVPPSSSAELVPPSPIKSSLPFTSFPSLNSPLATLAFQLGFQRWPFSWDSIKPSAFEALVLAFATTPLVAWLYAQTNPCFRIEVETTNGAPQDQVYYRLGRVEHISGTMAFAQLVTSSQILFDHHALNQNHLTAVEALRSIGLSDHISAVMNSPASDVFCCGTRLPTL